MSLYFVSHILTVWSPEQLTNNSYLINYLTFNIGSVCPSKNPINFNESV